MNIESLLLKRNAQIYTKIKKLKAQSKLEIIDEALKKSASQALIAEFGEGLLPPLQPSEPQVGYKYSAHVFTTRRKVDFLDEEKYDEVHAYFITIEIGEHLAILKKNCANIEAILEKHLKLLPHEKVLALASSIETEFQKIGLRNMTTSDRAIRGRQYEAANLNGLLSLHSAGRSIPHTMRVKQAGSIKSLTTSTARIIEQSERQAIEDIARWILLITHQLSTSSNNSEFLSSFAQPKNLDDVLKVSKPSSILFESGLIHESLELDEITLGRTNKAGDFLKLSNKTKEAILSALEPCYEIDSKKNINHPLSFSAVLKKNSKSLTFDIAPLKKIKVFDSITTCSLQQYIIKNRLYSICFTDPKFMYFKGECFEDKSGVSEIDSIIKILQEKPELKAATSEKGDLTSASVNFEVTSVFSIVENIHNTDDYIVCDDLGDEWADHITVNLANNIISFIHSKHGARSNSASKFHDVVGQGIKNIGNMTFNEPQISRKMKMTFCKTYNGNKVNTKISRVRRGSPTNFSAEIGALLEKPSIIRQCILACSFASKSDISKEFYKIKNNKKVSGNIIQLLWILSSFVHATKESNIVPIIYCQK